MNAKELLAHRLQQLGDLPFEITADNCRTAIISLLCAEAVAGRINGKLHTFRQLYALAFEAELETRERAAKRRAG